MYGAPPMWLSYIDGSITINNWRITRTEFSNVPQNTNIEKTTETIHCLHKYGFILQHLYLWIFLRSRYICREASVANTVIRTFVLCIFWFLKLLQWFHNVVHIWTDSRLYRMTFWSKGSCSMSSAMWILTFEPWIHHTEKSSFVG